MNNLIINTGWQCFSIALTPNWPCMWQWLPASKEICYSFHDWSAVGFKLVSFWLCSFYLSTEFQECEVCLGLLDSMQENNFNQKCLQKKNYGNLRFIRNCTHWLTFKIVISPMMTLKYSLHEFLRIELKGCHSPHTVMLVKFQKKGNDKNSHGVDKV